MSNTPAHEEHIAEWVEYEKEQLKKAEQQRQEAEARVNQIKAFIEAGEKVLRIGKELNAARSENAVLDTSGFRGVSVRNALVEIARRNNGILVIKEAVKTLQQAGVFTTAKAARGTVYSTASRSGKDFQKKSPGVYMLISSSNRQRQLQQHPVQPQVSIAEAVDQLLSQHPNWGFRELRDHLIESGFDFCGKTPSFVVNMALTQRRRKAHKSHQENVPPISQQTADQQPTQQTALDLQRPEQLKAIG